MKAIEITAELAAEHGLSAEEYAKILEILGRTPNITELGIFSVMWSEHCSYKSTRLHLKKLPTTAPWVICGPGENAGVIDIGDGQAAIFKMESHNHPSFIEPTQGAATGVGGILRDVFTMGARPVANLNSLRFGSLDHPKTRHLLGGVVAGIGGYGNCVGVPTVGGECTFHPSYNGNILVNAMNVGIAETNNIFYSAATSIGSPVVYVGSKTGRDGIHGATMASTEFDDKSEEKRPTVQVGDPFSEKLLIEACLELMATDSILSIQDMGAAGLTSSSLEMAGKGGTGIELNLDKVPMREAGMTPYEIMLSESQERMLMVIRPEKEAEAQAIFAKWELDFAVIGRITTTGRVVLNMHGETVADMPIAPLSDEAPIYDRPWKLPEKREMIEAASLPERDINEALKTLLGSPDLCSKRWIWEQYDSRVMNDTVATSNADAAIVRVHGTNKGLTLTSDCTPRYCFADPVEGGKQAVAEAWRNLTATGSTPLAITNCLNFGNPQKPEIMGQLVGCLQGITEACLALDFPVVSGNVSLYNETSGTAIFPTPSIGGVGLLPDVTRYAGKNFTQEGESIFLIGTTHGHMGSSLYLREVENREDGASPPVDLAVERKNGDFVRTQIRESVVTSCHDISDGGLYVAIAEMAMSAGIGASLVIENSIPLSAALFGEDQARYVVTTSKEQEATLLHAARSANVVVKKIGITGGNVLAVDGQEILLDTLKKVNEACLPVAMA